MNNTNINTKILTAYVDNRHKASLGDKIAEKRARIIFSAFSNDEMLLWLRAKAQCRGNETRALEKLKNPSSIFDDAVEYH